MKLKVINIASVVVNTIVLLWNLLNHEYMWLKIFLVSIGIVSLIIVLNTLKNLYGVSFYRKRWLKEPLVAYRVWNVNVSRKHLRALNGNKWIERMPNTAICVEHTHANDKPPTRNCECGYYAFKTLEHLKNEFLRVPPQYEVVGEVYLGGKIFEHEKGYRAQYAYPKKLYACNENLKKVQELVRLYGCEFEMNEKVYEISV